MKKQISFMLAVIMAVSVFLCLVGCSQPTYGMLNHAKLSSYAIVYAEGNGASRKIAEALKTRLKNYCDVDLSCFSDEKLASGNEILVGSTNRKQMQNAEVGAYTISGEKAAVFLAADNSAGLIAAAKRLAEDVYEGNVDYTKNPVTAKFDDLSVKIMSYNIRTTSEDRWDRLFDVISRNDPDLLGTQEVSTHWQSKLKDGLADSYTSVGRGRAEAGDEAGYIFFKTEKFQLFEGDDASGTYWYRDGDISQPGKYDKVYYPRIFTYAKLIRKSDNLEFVYVNTHLDLYQPARIKGMQLLVDFIEENFAGLPIYITGDFNTDVNEWFDSSAKWEWVAEKLDAYDADDVLDENDYENSRIVAPISDDYWTFPTRLYPSDWKDYVIDNGGKGDIIDYCFVKGNILVDFYKVDSDLPSRPNKIDGCGDDASDHYPIISETVLYKNFNQKKQGKKIYRSLVFLFDAQTKAKLF